MKRLLSAFIAIALLSGVVLLAVSSQTQAQVTASRSAEIERGRYLVGPAGHCTDCHGATLQGSSLVGLLNPKLLPTVARTAPKIAGLPMFNDDAAAIHFLQTAQLPGGARARQPMPQYQFDRDDATAIVAYLRSLH